MRWTCDTSNITWRSKSSNDAWKWLKSALDRVSGNAFQTDGLATENARQPNVFRRHRVTIKSISTEDKLRVLRVYHIIRSKNVSAASLNNSVTDDKSLSAKPNLLQRFRNESSRARSGAEQVRDEAGAQYVTFATTVARNTSCREVDVFGRSSKWIWFINAMHVNASNNVSLRRCPSNFYTVFRKKHPLTFCSISQWVMCRFKQKLQWICLRNGRFWPCRN